MILSYDDSESHLGEITSFYPVKRRKRKKGKKHEGTEKEEQVEESEGKKPDLSNKSDAACLSLNKRS